MQSINMRKLRTQLYGNDKLPREAEGTYPDFTLFDIRGNIVCRTTVVVIKQPIAAQPRPMWGKENAMHKSSGHRVHVLCPKCSKQVAAGRLPQHYEVHERELRELVFTALDNALANGYSEADIAQGIEAVAQDMINYDAALEEYTVEEIVPHIEAHRWGF